METKKGDDLGRLIHEIMPENTKYILMSNNLDSDKETELQKNTGEDMWMLIESGRFMVELGGATQDFNLNGEPRAIRILSLFGYKITAYTYIKYLMLRKMEN